MKRFIVCTDLGKKRDNYANMVIEAKPTIVSGSSLLQNPDRTVTRYHIVYLEQQKGLRYPEQVSRLVNLVNYAEIRNDYTLLVDGTGIGEPVVDYIRDAGLFPIPIIFTNGNTVNEIYADIGQVFAGTQDKLRAARTLKEIRIPRDDLVSAGQILMQQDRIRVAQGINYREELETQLMSFVGTKLNKTTGRQKYEAADEEIHDDLVVDYLMGAWWALHSDSVNGIKERVLTEDQEDTGWEPADFF